MEVILAMIIVIKSFLKISTKKIEQRQCIDTMRCGGSFEKMDT
jgi:hypothetical protein